MVTEVADTGDWWRKLLTQVIIK